MGINQIIGMFLPLNQILSEVYMVSPITLNSPENLETIVPMYEGSVPLGFKKFMTPMEVLKLWSPPLFERLVRDKMPVGVPTTLSDAPVTELNWDSILSGTPGESWADMQEAEEQSYFDMLDELQEELAPECVEPFEGDSGHKARTAKEIKGAAKLHAQGKLEEVAETTEPERLVFVELDEVLDRMSKLSRNLQNGVVVNKKMSLGKDSDKESLSRTIGAITVKRFHKNRRFFVADFSLLEVVLICLNSDRKKDKALILQLSKYIEIVVDTTGDSVPLYVVASILGCLWKMAVTPLPPTIVATKVAPKTDKPDIVETMFLSWLSSNVVDKKQNFLLNLRPDELKLKFANEFGLNVRQVPTFLYKNMALEYPVVLMKAVKMGVYKESSNLRGTAYVLILPDRNKEVAYYTDVPKLLVSYRVTGERVFEVFRVMSVRGDGFTKKLGLNTGIDYDEEISDFDDLKREYRNLAPPVPKNLTPEYWLERRQAFLAKVDKINRNKKNKQPVKPARAHVEKRVKNTGHKQKGKHKHGLGDSDFVVEVDEFGEY